MKIINNLFLISFIGILSFSIFIIGKLQFKYGDDARCFNAKCAE